MIDARLVICAVASVVGHWAIAHALDELPPRERARPPRTVEVRISTPPPRPPEPVPEPPPPPVPETPVVAPTKPAPERPRARPSPQPVITDVAPADTAPAPNAPVAGDATAKPVFGVAMESSPGQGPAVPVGNTRTPQPAGDRPAVVRPLGGPAAAHEVTKMPLPQGRCAGQYTDAAREAGIEGVVVLDLIVDEQGRAREITVIEGLGHGLTEAAVAALKACRFSAGEKAGVAVPVRVRGFKIRFVLDAQ